MNMYRLYVDAAPGIVTDKVVLVQNGVAAECGDLQMIVPQDVKCDEYGNLYVVLEEEQALVIRDTIEVETHIMMPSFGGRLYDEALMMIVQSYIDFGIEDFARTLTSMVELVNNDNPLFFSMEVYRDDIDISLTYTKTIMDCTELADIGHWSFRVENEDAVYGGEIDHYRVLKIIEFIVTGLEDEFGDIDEFIEKIGWIISVA